MLENLVTDLSEVHEKYKDLKSKNTSKVPSNVGSKRNSQVDIRIKPGFEELNIKLLAL